MARLTLEETMIQLKSRVIELEEDNAYLKAFYNNMQEHYGTGLEVANYHLNGNTEPFDDLFDSARYSEESVDSDR